MIFALQKRVSVLNKELNVSQSLINASRTTKQLLKSGFRIRAKPIDEHNTFFRPNKNLRKLCLYFTDEVDEVI